MVMNNDGTNFANGKPTHNFKIIIIKSKVDDNLRNIISDNDGNLKSNTYITCAIFDSEQNSKTAKSQLEDAGYKCSFERLVYPAGGM